MQKGIPRMKEKVNHPQHYGGDTTYETIKVLEAWMSPEEFIGFLRGNAIKYLSRAGKKEDALVDLQKAYWYLGREIGTHVKRRNQRKDKEA
jgi:hypothetical protein